MPPGRARLGARLGLTLVDGVLGELAELAADYPGIRAQELLLTGRQLQGGDSHG